MNISHPELSMAFNEWMRRYIDEPERFNREFETVRKFEAQDADKIEPDYGRSCASYIMKLIGEINGSV